MKKFLSVFLISILLLSSFSSCSMIEDSSIDNENLLIVTTIFPYYDFAKNIVGDKADVKMLLSPGTESHDFQPSPKDIKEIKNADIFIYNGGESDKWVETVLNSLDNNVKTLCMFDYITPVSVEDNHNEHHQEEYDEHIWTSPYNATLLVEAISEAVVLCDNSNKAFYKKNSQDYKNKLTDLDNKFETFFSEKTEPTLVVADRFPLIYFADRYSVNFISAFKGCSSDTEPTIETIKELTDFVVENNVPMIFHIDNSNAKFVELISEDTGAKVGTLYSCQNVTKEQFDKCENYISLMELNLETLKEGI